MAQPRSPKSSLHSSSRSWRWPLVVVLAGAVASCSAGAVSSANVNTGQTIMELTDAVTALQQRDAEMQMQIDSLQRTVLHQDSVIARLGASAGLVPPTTPVP